MGDGHSFDVPDFGAVLRDGTVTRELAGLSETLNGHLGPFVVVSVGLITLVLGVDVGVEIEAHDVLITSVGHVFDDWLHDGNISEESISDSLEDLSESSSNISSVKIK